MKRLLGILLVLLVICGAAAAWAEGGFSEEELDMDDILEIQEDLLERILTRNIPEGLCHSYRCPFDQSAVFIMI